MRSGTGLDEPLKRSPAAGSAALLEKLDLHTVRDLLWYFPRRYMDLGELTGLDELVPGELVTFLAARDEDGAR